MHFDPIFLTFIALTVAVCGTALWKGDAPERWAAGVLLLSMLPSIVLQTVLKLPDFPTVELADDGLTALSFLILLMIYGRLWLGAAMLFQAAQFTLHSYYLVTERESDHFHVIVNNVNFLGIMLSIAAGTGVAIHRRRKARRVAAAHSAA